MPPAKAKVVDPHQTEAAKAERARVSAQSECVFTFMRLSALPSEIVLKSFTNFLTFPMLLAVIWFAQAESAKAELIKAFNAFDLNKDGVVSEEELIRILMRPTEDGNQLDKETAKSMINSFESYDKNGDGVLSIEEFATALSAASPPKK